MLLKILNWLLEADTTLILFNFLTLEAKLIWVYINIINTNKWNFFACIILIPVVGWTVSFSENILFLILCFDEFLKYKGCANLGSFFLLAHVQSILIILRIFVL